MAKGSREKRRIAYPRCRLAPYPLPSSNNDILGDLCPKKCSKALDKKDLEDVTCSVCMECPHNAVLLLCSSHDKGCRPYMCGTSFRYSNCLDQYKKAYTKGILSNGIAEHPISVSESGGPVERCESTELACPLCRGLVKGWTVVEPAREYLNAKKRSCMQDDCSFVGTYKELRKHMKAEHPSACPRKVDPVLEQKWRRLEWEHERDDVISTIRSTMPGAMVFGDYVIEGNDYGYDTDEEDERFDVDAGERNGSFEVGLDRDLVNFFLLLHAFGPSGNGLSIRPRQSQRTNHRTDDSAIGIHHTSPDISLDSSYEDNDNDNDDDNSTNVGASLVSCPHGHHGRGLLGLSGRRRRRRDAGQR